MGVEMPWGATRVRDSPAPFDTLKANNAWRVPPNSAEYVLRLRVAKADIQKARLPRA